MPVVGLERPTSRSQGQYLNHYTTTDSENFVYPISIVIYIFRT